MSEDRLEALVVLQAHRDELPNTECILDRYCEFQAPELGSVSM